MRDPELLSSSVTPGFNMFLSSVGILWLLYLIIDIKEQTLILNYDLLLISFTFDITS